MKHLTEVVTDVKEIEPSVLEFLVKWQVPVRLSSVYSPRDESHPGWALRAHADTDSARAEGEDFWEEVDSVNLGDFDGVCDWEYDDSKSEARHALQTYTLAWKAMYPGLDVAAET